MKSIHQLILSLLTAAVSASMLSCSYLSDSSLHNASESTISVPGAEPTAKTADIVSFPESSDKKEADEPIILNQNNCTIDSLDNITYDGLTHTLGLSVRYNNQKLTPDKDYRVKYSDQIILPGKYTAEIIFQGNYKGKITQDFYLLPDKPEIIDVSAKTNSFHIQFSKPKSSVNGYVVEYSKDENFHDYQTLTISDPDTTSANIAVDADNGVRYLRVKAYIDGQNETLFSETSNVKKAELLKIIQKDGLTYIDGLIIANKTYSLPPDYDPGVNEEALAAFEKMAADAMENDGIYLTIVSGYRSYEVQDWLYHSYVQERGIENADKISARPGHSEHQTGYAFDINTTASSFAGTPEAEWLEQNSYKYGFIIRYELGKEETTGYSYEPWHIRYIGKEYAEKVYQSGLSLEEYLGITSKYPD